MHILVYSRCTLKILFIVHDIPSPLFSDTSLVFHMIKGLKEEYGLQPMLICFSSGQADSKTVDELRGYCTIADILPFGNPHRNRKIDSTIIPNVIQLCIGNIRNIQLNLKKGIYFNLLYSYYSKRMEETIRDFLDKEQIDILFVTRPMSIYVLDLNKKKIIQPYDAVSEWYKQVFLVTKGPEKVLRFILYLLTKQYEAKIYPLFDVCMLVTPEDELLIKRINSKIHTAVIPNGVDNYYFRPQNVEPEHNSLLFVSNMEGNPTVESILWFNNSVFPLIRSEVKDITLYLVGRNPAPEIRKLGATDPSVIVTGFVEDVREYLMTSNIFIAPMIKGTGIKTKVLEAMAMAKPVVSTTPGVLGINGQDRFHYFIADNPKDFSQCIITLLGDKQLCREIGMNARKLMENNYSWERITQKYYQLMEEVIRSNSQ
jgi:polysaccharide biosynthesis protein PslH